MDPDQNVCLCFRVSLRKLRTFMDRERPQVASQLSECLSAGTGCQWCVPFLCRLHGQWQAGDLPDLPVSPEEYAAKRLTYRQRRSAGATPDQARVDEGAYRDDSATNES
ncbi:MAG: (2Fe-2S)-binding protein [Phycisphaerae bacterium]|jgi:bacterioferritin-associated ferredoxin|nr:(2Fe-2S)-binding protein [Phycisphaerae bacterium]